jgi:hypothetical protein
MRKMIGMMALAGLILVGSAVPSFAREDCRDRVRSAEHNLQQAIRRHGRNSHQAQARRRQLERAREFCSEHRRGGYRQ